MDLRKYPQSQTDLNQDALATRTPNLIKSVKEKIRRNLRKSIRKMAKESKISPRTMCRICHDDLKMSP